MRACPPSTRYEMMLTGALDSAEDTELAAHLECCCACQEALERLTDGGARDQPDRDFIRRLQEIPQPPAWPAAVTNGAGERAGASPPAAGHWPTIPDYEILGELGRGGMGIIYKARQVRLRRLVALKMILTGANGGVQELARFRTEAELAARLQHPNIVQIHEVGEHDGRPFFSLEYVEGCTLAQHLDGTPQPPGQACQLIETLARAIHYAHQLGVVHRDLKPANVLLQTTDCRLRKKQPCGEMAACNLPDAIPKITDFGLAKRMEGGSDATRTGAIMGTPSYMAPEQATGTARAIGPATDVYALGTILYEMLTGRAPFKGETVLDTLQQTQKVEPVPPRHSQPKVPRDLETICLKCLEKEPRKRYASALALAEDLARFRNDRPIHAHPIRCGERLWRLCRRNPATAALVISVALLLLLLAGGSAAAAWWLHGERDVAVASERRALASEERAKIAEHAATDQLWDSYLAQAQAMRLSGHADCRDRGLAVIARAAAIRPSLELRNEAIAFLALTDLSFVRALQVEPSPAGRLFFDHGLERYAHSDRHGTLRIYSVADNKELRRLPGPGHPAWVAQFSPNGRFLATRHHPQHGTTPDVHLWNLAGGTAGNPGRPTRIRGRVWDFSPDSAQLATVQADGAIHLYDALSAKKVKDLGRGPPPARIAFHPSGKQLAIASRINGIVQIRNASTGDVVKTLTLPACAFGLAWGDEGRLLAAGCANARIYVWDLTTGAAPVVLEGHDTLVSEVVFNHAGDLLASGSWDRTIRLWDPRTGRQLAGVPGQGAPRFSLDDSALGLLQTPTRLGVWKVVRSRAYRTCNYPQPEKRCWCVGFSPDGRLLVAAGEDGVRLWDACTARQVSHLSHAVSMSACFQPGGKSLITSGWGPGLQCWTVATELVKGQRQTRIGPAQALALGSVQPSGTGKPQSHRFSQSANGQVRLVGLTGQGVVMRDDAPDKPVWLSDCPGIAYVALSPDGQWAATGSYQGTQTAVWDARTGKLQRDLIGRDAHVAFSPDGQWLVTGTAQEYRFWRVGTWKRGLRIPRDNPDGAGPMAFTSDGKLLAIADAGKKAVCLVDTATGQEVACLYAPQPLNATWLCFSPNDGKLAVACINQTIHLWDLQLLRAELQTMDLAGDLPAHAREHYSDEPDEITVLPDNATQRR